MSFRARCRAFCALLFSLSLALFSQTGHASTDWTQPTERELKMTSLPQVPGADAVVLYREEVIEDSDSSWSYYFRVKVLTSKGIDSFSKIAIAYPSGDVGMYSVQKLAGRTIHSDGTIIPFTGKPLDHVVVKANSVTVHEKVLVLPDVQVGSIVEYRYRLQAGSMFVDSYNFIPTWYVQSSHFEMHQHFNWKCNREKIAWNTLYANPGAGVQHKDRGAGTEFTLDRTDVMPRPKEPQMLPEDATTQKVVFYQVFGDIKTAEEFWKVEGKIWNDRIESFIGKPSKLEAIVTPIVAGAKTDDEKLRKIYAAVQQMKNTTYEREKTEKEDKRNGYTEPTSPTEVFRQQRGNNLQLNYVFVAMARAAGMKAHVMAVTNRDSAFFNKNLLTFHQLDDDVSIVEVDGKERFFDPAEPFCPYGELKWIHSSAGGVRQTESGTGLVITPGGVYTETKTLRQAHLKLDTDGGESGQVGVSFTGAHALILRQQLLTDDELALRKNLESYLKERLPEGTEVSVNKINNLRDENSPLIAIFDVHGPWAARTGKRMIIPSQFFQNADVSVFASEQRETMMYFDYAEITQDLVQTSYPTGWSVESRPNEATATLPQLGGYRSDVSQVGTDGLSTNRVFAYQGLIVSPENYKAVRTFFTSVAEKDKEPIILSSTAAKP